ncbi:unnamed protein product [Parnassius apollo]|uniref:(apollo) hypothetical protein n=1 Tax=Parnassius apollo TaxID=110799 RepID=A0A8S3WR41_PARAO|nr:unnamed protein product [Parnassius apollo]
MPLKRTPPPSPLTTPVAPTFSSAEYSANTLTTKEISYMHHSDSAPDLTTLTTTVSERKKRKHPEGDDSITSLIKDMFTNFSKEQETRFYNLQSTIVDLKEQNYELKRSVEHMSNKYDDLLTIIANLEKERKEDKRRMALKEDRLETMERKMRASGIEVRNIPKTKDFLFNIITKTGKAVNISIEDSELKDIYRLNSKDSSGPIIVELNSVISKEKILRAVQFIMPSMPSKLQKSNRTCRSPY